MAKPTKPYKMTPERVAIILEGLSNGLTQRDCALLAGIHEDTLCSWKFNNSEFSEQMGQKLIEYKQKLLKRIEKAGEKDWKATAWILERKFKNDWGTNARYDTSDLYDMPPLASRGLDHDILADRMLKKFIESS
jgi:hypothetical protein